MKPQSSPSSKWNRKPQLSGETLRVVVITSGKGGFSKTITTANVGLSLAHFGFSVVAIDADVDLRNLDLLLGLENRISPDCRDWGNSANLDEPRRPRWWCLVCRSSERDVRLCFTR
ncbi:hypothetical protein Dsin_006645 [Dipteronia sinensis]|uniref:CobQ/CobB/MinD/ParA nucleotide binding domain-containing protein n=1 Tax=Dipteronia sinensis TaxID=43782 RepID=A0AAE0AYR9_9ROSI|nr:hypothetical protein Dsin_006645 [Dipteronia sinensis]